MRFISKNSNLRIILKPGLPASPLTGTLAVPAVSAKFVNGELTSSDENMVNMLLAHPGFNMDYIAVDENGADPFKSIRQENEPKHTITELKYGHVGESMSSKQTPVISPALEKAINELAMAKVAELLPKALEAALTSAAAKQVAEKAPVAEDVVETKETPKTSKSK